MNLKRKCVGKYVFGTIIGLFILATGGVIAKMMRDIPGVLGSLPYIFIGIGAGTFGECSSKLLKLLALKDSPEIAESIEIEESDERNIMIRDKARAQAFQLALFVYGALMFAFGLMKVDIAIVITMVVAYLFITFASIYFRSRLEKQL